jgi:carbamoyltransferase
MIVLGIADSFTSGAALVIDGRIRAAVNEERLNRHKMSMGFPNLAVREVMRIAGVEPGDIDRVAVATQNLFWRPEALPYQDYFRDSKGRFRDAFLALGSKASTLAGGSALARQAYYRLKQELTRYRRRELPRRVVDEFGIRAPLEFLDHHLCHAASAYYTAGFEDATVITQDGAGDFKCGRVYQVTRGEFHELDALDSYDSVGNFYSYVTHLCGFQAHKHEGKITGLAAHGEPEYLDLFRRYVEYGDGRIANIGRCFDHSALRKLEKELPSGFSHEALSATVQVLLEDAVSDYVGHWLGRSGHANVALAGGVFANVKLNQRVHELDGVEAVFVHPGMGDDGLATGAALFAHAQLTGSHEQDVLQDVYLGGDIEDRDATAAIQRSGLPVYAGDEPLTTRVAGLLAEGRVVARCAGRMEYGPRALGNRTIMYQTTDPDVNTWLNKKLRRTEFMPFAPVTMWEHREACYKGLAGAEHTARFMTITFNCTEEMQRTSPAVCHVDHTARPQLIRRDDNPAYYDILAEYHRITGIPSVVNTSFNIHEEPIVNTPEEAIRAFLDSELDALVLGDHLVYSPALASKLDEELPPSGRRSYAESSTGGVEER